MPIQLPPDSTGKLIETVVVTSSENREVMILGSTTLAYAPVTSSAGLLTSLSSGTVTLSSAPTVTATAATNPWSSAPGFNVPVVSVSSGLTQISGTVTVLSASSGQVQISGTPNVTSTAATNPWSSAPGFNLPTVSVSSGLSQVSAVQVSPTSSVAGAGFLVITSSFGLLTQSTQPITITSGTVTLSQDPTGTAFASATRIASSVTNISSSGGSLYMLTALTTTPTGAVLRLYNATTSNVVMGTGIMGYCLVGAQTSATPYDVTGLSLGTRPYNFVTACSFDVVLDVTSTLAVAGNTYVTFQYA